MNKKGFTLVEIIVGIAIGSVLLAVASSMIVSSYKTVYNTTDMDMDKRIVDSVADVVRSDTQYCFDVRLVKNEENKPDVAHEEGWHWLYVKEGQLYRDDKSLFDASYYSNKTIKIKVNVYVMNDVRVDFTYYLVDQNGKEVYSTRDTLLYLNVQKLDSHEGLYSKGNFVELTMDNPNSNTGNDTYRLYFRNVKPTTTEPDTPPTETEEKWKDNILSNGMVTEGNYVGKYEDFKFKGFHAGSVVFYDGAYWQLVKDNNKNTVPGKIKTEQGGEKVFVWRKLNSEYASNSCYLKNDIVVDKDGVYYRAKNKVEKGEKLTDTNYWERLGKINDPNVKEILETNQIERIEPYISTVQEAYWPKDGPYKATFAEVQACTPSECKFQLYDSTKQYSVGSYVITSGNILYYKGFDGDNIAPGNASSGWIKLSVYYDPNSSYLKDDIVALISKGNDQMYYKQAVKQISVNNSMNLTVCWKDYTLK